MIRFEKRSLPGRSIPLLPNENRSKTGHRLEAHVAPQKESGLHSRRRIFLRGDHRGELRLVDRYRLEHLARDLENIGPRLAEGIAVHIAMTLPDAVQHQVVAVGAAQQRRTLAEQLADQQFDLAREAGNLRVREQHLQQQYLVPVGPVLVVEIVCVLISDQPEQRRVLNARGRARIEAHRRRRDPQVMRAELLDVDPRRQARKLRRKLRHRNRAVQADDAVPLLAPARNTFIPADGVGEVPEVGVLLRPRFRIGDEVPALCACPRGRAREERA